MFALYEGVLIEEIRGVKLLLRALGFWSDGDTDTAVKQRAASDSATNGKPRQITKDEMKARVAEFFGQAHEHGGRQTFGVQM